jgi:hypothetical protein
VHVSQIDPPSHIALHAGCSGDQTQDHLPRGTERRLANNAEVGLSMPVLQSSEPEAPAEKSGDRMRIAMKELRNRSITIGWAVAVVVATIGWFYFIARGGWFFINWIFD